MGCPGEKPTAMEKIKQRKHQYFFEEMQLNYDSLNVASLGICNPLRKKQQQWEKRLRKS